jgi:hypothetical protein
VTSVVERDLVGRFIAGCRPERKGKAKTWSARSMNFDTFKIQAIMCAPARAVPPLSLSLSVYHKHTLILLLWWAHAHKNTTATAVFLWYFSCAEWIAAAA